MQSKYSNIELGGPSFKTLSPTKYIQRAQKPPSNGQQRMTVVSTHRIAGKVSPSPSKYRTYTNQTSRNASFLSSENSFVEQDSSVLTVNQSTKPQSPLRDASNLTVGGLPKKLVRVNFISNSPTCSRTSSTHIREVIHSPSKMIRVESREGRERQEALERKMKVLQGRIGELHREKHELAGKLNEENRKLIQENTAMRLRISELTRKLDNKSSKQTTSLAKIVTVDKKAQAQVQELKIDIAKLQQIIEGLTQKSESFVKQCQALKDQLQETNQIIQQLQKQNQKLNDALHHKEEQYDSLHCEYLQLNEQKIGLESMKEHYESEIQQIQASLNETAQGNQLIIQEYQNKLEEYRVAYDRNQEVIQQLSQQLQQAYSQPQPQHQPYPDSDEVVNQQTEGEITEECKNLESNFLQALEEREEQTQALKSRNYELSQQLAARDQLINQLQTQLQEQAGRLEQVGGVLQRYTSKIHQMENRYEQLRQQHQIQKQKVKVESIPLATDKCKKCEELTKTIFRLNAHLNKRT